MATAPEDFLPAVPEDAKLTDTYAAEEKREIPSAPFVETDEDVEYNKAVRNTQQMLDEFNYDAYINAAQQNIEAAREADAEQRKIAGQIARQQGRPVSQVLSTEQIVNFREQDSYDMPVTRKLVGDRYDGAYYGGYIQFLSTTERILGEIEQGWGMTWDNIRLGKLKTREMQGEVLTPEDRAEIEEIKSRRQQRIDYETGFLSGIPGATAEMLPYMIDDFINGVDEGIWGAAAYGTMAAGYNAAIAASGVGAPAAAISQAGAMAVGFGHGMLLGRYQNMADIQRGLAYDEILGFKDANGNGVDPETARFYANLIGYTNAGLEVVGEQAVGKLIPGIRKVTNLPMRTIQEALRTKTGKQLLTEFAKRNAGAITAESATEMLQEFLQMFGNYSALKASTTGEFQPEVAFEGARQRIGEAGLTAVQATIGMGALGAPIDAVNGYREVRTAQRRMEADLRRHEFYKNNNTMAKENPEAAKSAMVFMQQELGVEDAVYIDKKTLVDFFAKAGLRPEDLAGVMPKTIRQVNDAAHTAEIIVPFEEYETIIMPSEYFPELAPYVRHSIDAMTANEAQEVQSDLQSIMEQLEDEEAKSEHPAYTNVYAALKENAGMSSEMADLYARMMGAIYTQLAEKTGKTVEELWQAHRVGVNSLELDPSINTTTFMQPGTPAFNAWFGDSKVVDTDGRPVVVYHGSFNTFDAFSREYANPYGNLGAGFYFSSHSEDVNRNYATVFSPDRRHKIERRVEEIERQHDEGTLPDELAYLFEAEDIDTAVYRYAESEAHEHILPVFLKIENPVILHDDFNKATKFEGTIEFDEEGTVVTEEGKGVDLLAQLYNWKEYGYVEYYDMSPIDDLYTTLVDDSYITAQEVYEALVNAGAEFVGEESSPGEVFRQLMDELGYDGIIDYTVARKFPQLIDDPSTAHYVVFSPEQVKSIFNKGTYDISNPNILYQRVIAEAVRLPPEEKRESPPPTVTITESLKSAIPSITDSTGQIELFRKMGLRHEIDLADTRTISFPTADDVAMRYVENLLRPFSSEKTNEVLTWDDLGLTGRPDLQQAAIVTLYSPAGVKVSLPEVEKTITQMKGEEPRGWISFPEDRSYFNITLTGRADPSTFIHETAHFALEMYRVLAPANPEIASDLKLIYAELGVDLTADITEAQHEQFARSFEAYVMEGKSPSVELRSAFARLKGLLMLVYSTIRGLDVELTDEMRSVFDRMLADQSQIMEARRQSEVDALFTDKASAMAAGMTESEYEDYQRTVAESIEEADRQMQGPMMRAARAMTRREYREAKARYTEEIRKEVMNRREQIARSVLTEGVMPDGTKVDNPPKLNWTVIYKNYPKGTLPKLKGMTSREGAHPDLVAYDFGFDSGEQLITALTNSMPLAKTVRAEVNARLMREFGDIKDPLVEAERAQEALHNDKVSRYILAELKVLGARTEDVERIKLAAQQAVEADTVRELKPHVYREAEQRYAREARRAAAKKDYDKALDARMKQLANYWRYREALKAKQESDKIRKYLKRFSDSKLRKRLGLAAPLQLEAIDALLDNTNFNVQKMRESKTEMRSLNTILEEIEGQGQITVVAMPLRENQKFWKDMTMSELRSLRDAVKNLETLARAKNELRTFNKKVAFDTAKIALLRSIEESGESAPPSFTLGNKTKAQKMRSWLRKIDAELTKPEFITRWLDGGKVGGTAHELLFQPLADAQILEMDMLTQMGQSLLDPFNEFFSDPANRARLAQKIKLGSFETDFEGVLAMALNMGNESNMTKMLQGFEVLGINREMVANALNKYMTKADWDLVQTIWDNVETLWGPIADLQQRTTGVRPEKVEAVQITTPYGTYRGGYYPMVYDPEYSYLGLSISQRKNDMFENNYMRAWVEHGFTKGRTKVAAPILLKVAPVVRGHIAEVIHYLTHYEAVTSVDKLLRDPEIRQAIVEAVGLEMYAQFNPSLQAIADGMVQQDRGVAGWSKVFNHARSGLSMAALGFNFITAAKQYLGLFNSAKELGAWEVAKAAKYVYAHRKEAGEIAYELSGEYRHVMETYDRELREALLWLDKDPVTRNLRKFKDFAFKMIGMVQREVNLITFHAAFSQYMRENPNATDAQATQYAEAIVRQSQSAAGLKDLAAIQRGNPAMKLWITFYTYFSVLYNQLRLSGHEAAKNKDVATFAAEMAYLLIMPALIESLLAGDAPDADAEPEEWLKWATKETALYGMSTLPIARDIATGILDDYGFRTSGVQIIESLGVGALAAEKLVTGEDLTQYEQRQLLTSIGIATHLPANQLWKTGNAIVNYDQLQYPWQLATGVPKE